MNRKKETLDDLLAIPEDKRTEADTQILGIVMEWLQADQETKDIVLGLLRGDIDPGIVRGEIDIAASVSVLR